jgi:lysophospholipid acyltransferase (LPLAT)-like uncharacterized protein
MTETSSSRSDANTPAVTKRRPGRRKKLWRAIRQPIANSRFFKAMLVSALASGLRFTNWTNRRLDTLDADAVRAEYEPAILALWHGQHLMAPCLFPKGYPLVAMVSRSADAELNAKVFERLGFQAVRGSGGRANSNNADKGGASALIALKKTLDAGINVAMIADIPHGTPREAGMGIVTLAKLSGRPILPIAVATSRRKVLEKSWDKTTINLPFGRSAAALGKAVRVPANATDQECEAARWEVTRSLNDATAEAYRLVDAGI